MKIKNKLALLFTLLTLMLMVILCSFVYYSFLKFTREDFFLRLQERAVIAGEARLEKDEVSASIYQDILNQHLRKLPDEQEYIFKKASVPTLQKRLNMPVSFFEEIEAEGYARYKGDNLSWVGMQYQDNEGNFIVLVSARDTNGSQRLMTLRNSLLAGILLISLLIFVIGQWFANQMLQPINRIIEQVRLIKGHNLHLRVAEPTQKDELQELCVTFNEMLSSLEMTFNVQHNFISNASHELKTPLTSILGEAEYAQIKPRSNEEYLQVIQNIGKAAERLEKLTYELLKANQTYVGKEHQIFEDIHLKQLLLETIKNMPEKTSESHILLQTDEDERIVRGNPQLLEIAFKNLLKNAIKYSQNQQVKVCVSTEDSSARIDILDQGIGIPLKELAYIKQPFYRASNAKSFQGFGMGLTLANNIVEMHQGRLQLESHLKEGTQVSLWLPLKEH